jgi:acetyl-CoA carboxylase, biotin carboxylase subunit
MLFKKVLVANRGEIALRIIRTLKDMGIPSVAVFSDADAHSPVLRLADEAVWLGPTPAADSYLNFERVLEAARVSGCDAVIPGYGFLSENAEFRAACDRAGLTFVGPSSQVIASFGSKLEARKLVSAAGVPVVPGGPIDSVADARRLAAELGYPVLLKAAFGGGGKGMRLVYSPDEFEAAWSLASSEARRSFGSDVVYLEKAIVGPRHIEIQILGDQFGNLVHLGERECSVQRRHQKVIEETPAPRLSAATRQRMADVALAAAAHIGYYSAGTFEFLVDDQENFFFLEVNTRLQVEHTVTELVTGIDLVEAMIRIAAGLPLGFAQDDVMFRGAAIQARVYAEDPRRGFMPTGGTVGWFRQPAGPNIRFDHALEPNLRIADAYDPLLGKLCAWGLSRREAISRIARALDELHIGGLTSNIELLREIVVTHDFQEGHYDTRILANWESDQSTRAEVTATDQLAALAVAAELLGNPAPAATVATPGLSEWVRSHRQRVLS